MAAGARGGEAAGRRRPGGIENELDCMLDRLIHPGQDRNKRQTRQRGPVSGQPRVLEQLLEEVNCAERAGARTAWRLQLSAWGC